MGSDFNVFIIYSSREKQDFRLSRVVAQWCVYNNLGDHIPIIESDRNLYQHLLKLKINDKLLKNQLLRSWERPRSGKYYA
jgi:hypothetical protein